MFTQRIIPQYITLPLIVGGLFVISWLVLSLIEDFNQTPPEFEGTYKSLAWHSEPSSAPNYIMEKAREDEILGTSFADYALSRATGKVVLLNFWASWCAPCLEELPSLNALQEGYSKDEFEVIAISLDRAEEQKDALEIWESLGLKNLTFYREAHDLKLSQKASSKFLLEAFPTTILLDKGHNMRAILLGDADWSSSEGEKVIDFLL